MSNFKKEHDFERRTKESSNILEKYPDRVPVIVERAECSKNLTIIDKRKFLVPKELKMSQLLWVVRKRMSITRNQAIYLLSNSGRFFPGTEQISTIYENDKDADGFLYIKYANENTFG